MAVPLNATGTPQNAESDAGAVTFGGALVTVTVFLIVAFAPFESVAVTVSVTVAGPSSTESVAFEPELEKITFPQAAEMVARQAEGYSRAAGRGWMPRPEAKREPIQVRGRGADSYVTNLLYGAHLQEWGSKNNPAHAPLRRGVRSAGFRLQED